jgi:hypothetical protein
MNAAYKLPTYQADNATVTAAQNLKPVFNFSDIQPVLDLMGWGELPEALLEVIHSDLLAYKYELKGEYSTSSRYVHNRRKRIVKWVETFQAGNCDLDTIIDALKIRSI